MTYTIRSTAAPDVPGSNRLGKGCPCSGVRLVLWEEEMNPRGRQLRSGVTKRETSEPAAPPARLKTR